MTSKIVVSGCLLFVLFAGISFRSGSRPGAASKQQEGNQAPLSIDDLRALAPAALSPYLIERYVKDHKTADLKEVFGLLDPRGFSDEPGQWEGRFEAQHWDIETAEGRTVVLKISFAAFLYDCRYLVFKRVESGAAEELWRFQGYFDSSPDQHYEPTEQRVETGTGRTWFVVKELWGRGSGVILYGERWYELSDKPPREVLSYPEGGYCVLLAGSIGREFSSVVNHRAIDGIYRIGVVFGVSYSIYGDHPLFSRRQRAYYVWNDDQGTFLLDEARSEVSAKEICLQHRLPD
jgi:hypothetical protein